ncbi:hypothetical protein STVA_41490 [Allostella vacuolata]|nr:hypothetical protein STVA_41490 [Stella vacuolata]
MSAAGLSSRAIIGEFYARLEAATGMSWITALSMLFQSDQGSEEYKWLGQAPVMREWVGGREAKGFRENGFTVPNKTFEATTVVSVDDLRRDKTGQVMLRIGEMAGRTVSHDAGLISTLIVNGGTGLCYDGQYFFDTDHAEGANGSQSNIVTWDISDGGGGGTATAPTAKTMADAIVAGIARMLSFKDDVGEPLNEMAKDFVVMVPPSMMGPALAATGSAVIDSNQTNVIVAQKEFRITPVVNPRLAAWTDKFALFRADGDVKPFIRQYEEDVTLQALAEGSEEEVKNNRHLYGVKKIANAAYGYWQHACQVGFQA